MKKEKSKTENALKRHMSVSKWYYNMPRETKIMLIKNLVPINKKDEEVKEMFELLYTHI